MAWAPSGRRPRVRQWGSRLKSSASQRRAIGAVQRFHRIGGGRCGVLARDSGHQTVSAAARTALGIDRRIFSISRFSSQILQEWDARAAAPRIDDQKCSRSVYCICRPRLACVTDRPNCGLPTVIFGRPGTKLFVRL